MFPKEILERLHREPVEVQELVNLVARRMHSTYVRAAPNFGWEVNKDARRDDWEGLPEPNRLLMLYVVYDLWRAGFLLLPDARDQR